MKNADQVIGLVQAPNVELAYTPSTPTETALRALGAIPVLLGGTQGIYPHKDGSVQCYFARKEGRIALNVDPVVVDALLNYSYSFQSGLPSLNDQRVREAARKDRLYAELPDVTAPAKVFERPEQGVAAYLPGAQHFVVKPILGGASSGMDRVRAAKIDAYLADRFSSRRNKGPVIVQEAFRFHPWPASIKGPKWHEENLLRYGEVDDRELRMYYWGGKFVPMARIVPQGEDGDVFVEVEPESIPDESYKLADSVVRWIKMKSGCEQMAITVDLVYATTLSSGEKQPRWYLLEVNYRDPLTPEAPGRYAELANGLHESRARQLIQICTTGVEK